LPLTPEENEEFIKIRHELVNLKTAFEHFARQVGVNPTVGDPNQPDNPAAPTIPLHLIPDDVAASMAGYSADAAVAARRRQMEASTHPAGAAKK
jgi:hypothetical protein